MFPRCLQWFDLNERVINKIVLVFCVLMMIMTIMIIMIKQLTRMGIKLVAQNVLQSKVSVANIEGKGYVESFS